MKKINIDFKRNAVCCRRSNEQASYKYQVLWKKYKEVVDHK